tara:strand:- start:139 stop:540 length:402 start_codon:yes stop_codon:yes gene_type:complete
MKTDKKPQSHTMDAIKALVAGPGAVLWVPEVRGEFVLARVEFIQRGGQKAMKWVGTDPATGHDIHWTLYHKLGSAGDYHYLLGTDGKMVAEVSTLDEAPYTEEGPLKQRLAKWRHVLTLHHNQEEFDEFFENE